MAHVESQVCTIDCFTDHHFPVSTLPLPQSEGGKISPVCFRTAFQGNEVPNGTEYHSLPQLFQAASAASGLISYDMSFSFLI